MRAFAWLALGPGVAARAEQAKPILFLADADYPPLSYLEDGQPKGMDVDLASALSSAMDRPIHVELMDWGIAQERVLSGDADGLMSLSISEERRHKYDFTEMLQNHEFNMFVRRGDVTSWDVSILPGKKVGVTPGGLPRVLLRQQSSLELVLIADYEAGFARLREGLVDAVAADRWVGAHVLQSLGFSDIIVVAQPFATAQAGIAVLKGNRQLLDELNRAIRTRKGDGTIASIQRRWRPQEVVFFSRDRMFHWIAAAAGAALVILLTVLTLSVITLKRQVRGRLLAEAALKENEERLVTALSAADMGTWRWSPLTNLTRRDANLNRMVGLPAVESEHRFEDYLLRIHPDDRASTQAAFDLAVHNRQNYAAEYRVIRPDGTQRWLRAHGKPISSESGELSCVTGAVIDITERRATEEDRDRLSDQLRHAERLQSVGRLAGGIAHDFNNLLTVINGYADMLLSRSKDGDPQQRHLREIRTAGERAAGLTQQLLTFSRKQFSQPTVIHLNALVSESTDMLRRLLTASIEMTTALNAAPDVVRADPGELHQVLMNLATNARDAMKGGGKLTIETLNVEIDAAHAVAVGATAGSYVALLVTDSGLGMNAEQRQHIFDPFFTTKDVGQGTGLGLATVHGIVQGSHGFITVDSEPGKGSAFRIHLPVSEDTTAEAPAGAPRSACRGHETVLVVEDQEAVRRLVVDTLRAQGYVVIDAARGSDALALLERHTDPIDILLTDVVMPGMTGLELYAEIRQTRPDMKVAFMSGYNEEACLSGSDPAIETGCLRKPFGATELVTTVRAALDRPQLAR